LYPKLWVECSNLGTCLEKPLSLLNSAQTGFPHPKTQRNQLAQSQRGTVSRMTWAQAGVNFGLHEAVFTAVSVWDMTDVDCMVRKSLPFLSSDALSFTGDEASA
jgi:hypothetical protein